MSLDPQSSLSFFVPLLSWCGLVRLSALLDTGCGPPLPGEFAAGLHPPILSRVCCCGATSVTPRKAKSPHRARGLHFAIPSRDAAFEILAAFESGRRKLTCRPCCQ